PLMVLAGLLLSLHFWSWIASLRYTAVASSVVLVSLKSVFAWAIAALWLHEHPTRAEAWGIALAVSGASLIGVGDARFSVGALGEPVGASVIAWLVPAIHEVPSVTTVVGGVLVLVGIGLALGPRQ